MNARTIGLFAAVATAVSAAIALVALAISAFQIQRDLRAASIKEWQEVAIYSIVSSAGLAGVDFNTIQTRFATTAPDFGSELPVGEINTQALKRTLLSLMAKRAISLRPDARYGIALEPVNLDAIRASEVAARMDRVAEELLKLVAASPGRYTLNELRPLLSARHTFIDDEYFRLTSNMARAGAFFVGKDGKLSPSVDSVGRPQLPPIIQKLK